MLAQNGDWASVRPLESPDPATTANGKRDPNTIAPLVPPGRVGLWSSLPRLGPLTSAKPFWSNLDRETLYYQLPSPLMSASLWGAESRALVFIPLTTTARVVCAVCFFRLIE